MSDTININGNSIPTTVQEKDASGSDYILLQTKGEPLNAMQTTQLRALGVVIQEFVGKEGRQLYLCAYKPSSLDALRQLDFIEYANVYLDGFVVSSEVRKIPGNVTVEVLLHQDVVDHPALVQRVASAANVDVSHITTDSQMLRLTVSPDRLDNIAAVDEVRVIHPVRREKLFNTKAAVVINASGVKKNNITYRGEGQIVAVADTGFDTGNIANYHTAFANRVLQLLPLGGTIAEDTHGHGTHVCGSVLGQGISPTEGKVEGTAPAAKLVMQALGPNLSGIPSDYKILFQQAYDAGARVHTNSWGSSPDKEDAFASTPVTQYAYNARCENIDQFIFENQDMTILYAAGNNGQDVQGAGKVSLNSIGAQPSSKNCITVGAIENDRPTTTAPQNSSYDYGTYWPQSFQKDPIKTDHMANSGEGMCAFSSRGPTVEKRQKPDVVAPGTAILSTRSSVLAAATQDYGISKDDKYMYDSGTSMATPLVAGCCAVLRETLVKNGYKDKEGNKTNPTASLIKALLINGADTIKGQYSGSFKEVASNPDNNAGFGRVNLANSVVVPGDKYAGYWTNSLRDSSTQIALPLTFPEQNKAFTIKATLVYADWKGGQLNNDLNLVVVIGNKQRHGNQIDQEFALNATMPFDRLNNVEQVVWPGVQATSGSAKLIVKAFRITNKNANAGATANDAGVPFAVVWRFIPQTTARMTKL